MADGVNSRRDHIQSVDITSVEVEDYAVDRWPLSTIPIEPYLIEEPSENHGRYLDGPITPHLLRLQPGNPETATEFARKLGILGLWRWAATELADTEPAAWRLWEAIPHERDPEYESRDSWVERSIEQLSVAWTHEATVETFKSSKSGLQVAWDWFADRADDLDYVALFTAIETAPPATAMPLKMVPYRDTFVLSPGHALARSWLELIHLLRTQRLRPARCEHCGQLFPPKRAGQKYCPGASCARDHYRSHGKTEHRREYQRMYKRYRRGVISLDEWDAWRDANPDTRQAGTGRTK